MADVLDFAKLNRILSESGHDLRTTYSPGPVVPSGMAIGEAPTETFTEIPDSYRNLRFKLGDSIPETGAIDATDATRFVNLIRSGLQGQFAQEPTEKQRIVKSERPYDVGLGAEEYAFRRQTLGGLPSWGFQVDHIVPFWAGGTDTAENKQILPLEQHDHKTKVGAVARTLYYSGRLDLPEARMYALNWQSLDPAGIELDDKGNVDLLKAIEKLDEWRKPEYSKFGVKRPRWKAILSGEVGLGEALKQDWKYIKEGLTDFAKELPAMLPVVSWGVEEQKRNEIQLKYGRGVAELMPDNMAGEFYKGFVSGLSMGHVPTIKEAYEEQLDPGAHFALTGSRAVGHTAGFLASFLPINKFFATYVFAPGLPGAKLVSKVAPKLPAVPTLKILPRFFMAKFVQTFPGFALHGQLSNHEKHDLNSHIHSLIDSAMWAAAVSAVPGKIPASVSSLGETPRRLLADSMIGSLTYGITKLGGGTTEEALQAGLIMAGLHHIAHKNHPDYLTYFREDLPQEAFASAQRYYKRWGVRVDKAMTAEEALRSQKALFETIRKSELPPAEKRAEMREAAIATEMQEKAAAGDFMSLIQRAARAPREEITGETKESRAGLRAQEIIEERPVEPSKVEIRPEEQFLFEGEMLLRGATKATDPRLRASTESALAVGALEPGERVVISRMSMRDIRDKMIDEGKTPGFGDKNLAVFAREPYKTPTGTERRTFQLGYIAATEAKAAQQISYLPEQYRGALNKKLNAEAIINIMERRGITAMEAEVVASGKSQRSGEPFVAIRLTPETLGSAAEFNKYYKTAISEGVDATAETIRAALAKTPEALEALEAVPAGTVLREHLKGEHKTLYEIAGRILDNADYFLSGKNRQEIRKFFREELGIDLTEKNLRRLTGKEAADLTVENLVDFIEGEFQRATPEMKEKQSLSYAMLSKDSPAAIALRSEGLFGQVMKKPLITGKTSYFDWLADLRHKSKLIDLEELGELEAESLAKVTEKAAPAKPPRRDIKVEDRKPKAASVAKATKERFVTYKQRIPTAKVSGVRQLDLPTLIAQYKAAVKKTLDTGKPAPGLGAYKEILRRLDADPSIEQADIAKAMATGKGYESFSEIMRDFNRYFRDQGSEVSKAKFVQEEPTVLPNKPEPVEIKPEARAAVNRVLVGDRSELIKQLRKLTEMERTASSEDLPLIRQQIADLSDKIDTLSQEAGKVELGKYADIGRKVQREPRTKEVDKALQEEYEKQLSEQERTYGEKQTTEYSGLLDQEAEMTIREWIDAGILSKDAAKGALESRELRKQVKRYIATGEESKLPKELREELSSKEDASTSTKNTDRIPAASMRLKNELARAASNPRSPEGLAHVITMDRMLAHIFGEKYATNRHLNSILSLDTAKGRLVAEELRGTTAPTGGAEREPKAVAIEKAESYRVGAAPKKKVLSAMEKRKAEAAEAAEIRERDMGREESGKRAQEALASGMRILEGERLDTEVDFLTNLAKQERLYLNLLGEEAGGTKLTPKTAAEDAARVVMEIMKVVNDKFELPKGKKYFFNGKFVRELIDSFDSASPEKYAGLIEKVKGGKVEPELGDLLRPVE